MGGIRAGLSTNGGYLPKTTFQPHKMWVGESVSYAPAQGELVLLAAGELLAV